MSEPHSFDLKWENLMQVAEAEVEATLRKLPAPLREQAETLPVTFERRPGRGMLADGIADDTMGLFVGAAFSDELVALGDVPAQILLFLDNILEESEGHERTYRLEVRRTYLHELGHFLGLDEGELEARHLE
jgi:predicted Zn-dependent protease with MMP-like domain